MEQEVHKLFERYEEFFERSLADDFDKEEVSELYASEFIAANPAGVMAGKNDETLVQAMVQGYQKYREIGTRQMRKRNIRLSPIDDLHCVAHVPGPQHIPETICPRQPSTLMSIISFRS